MSDLYKPAATVEEDFVNLVRREMNDIKNSFFKIGFRLGEAQRMRYFKKLGFDTIEECAEALFGFKKSTTYDLINVASRFSDPKAPIALADNYKKFSQSQLVLFTSVKYQFKDFIKLCSPDDTIDKLRRAKNYWTNRYLGNISIPNFWNIKTIDELIEAGDKAIENRQGLSEKDFKTLDNIINKKVQMSGKDTAESVPDIENSGCPEKVEEGPIVLDVPVEDSGELSCEIEFLSKELKEKIVISVSKDLDLMSYKTIFDPDDKGLGIRVQSDQLVRFVLSKFFEAIDREKLRVSLLNEWNKK